MKFWGSVSSLLPPGYVPDWTKSVFVAKIKFAWKRKFKLQGESMDSLTEIKKNSDFAIGLLWTTYSPTVINWKIKNESVCAQSEFVLCLDMIS